MEVTMKLVLAVLALILAICDASASAGQLKKLYCDSQMQICTQGCRTK
jgi:hypothetical protein